MIASWIIGLGYCPILAYFSYSDICGYWETHDDKKKLLYMLSHCLFKKILIWVFGCKRIKTCFMIRRLIVLRCCLILVYFSYRHFETYVIMNGLMRIWKELPCMLSYWELEYWIAKECLLNVVLPFAYFCILMCYG